MPIAFQCPHCHAETDVDDCYAGQTGPCAVCGKPITVPYAATVAAADPVARQANSPATQVKTAVGIEPTAARRTVISPPSTGRSVGLVIGMSVVGLLCAVALFGTLITLTMPLVRSAQQSAQVSQCSTNLRKIARALQAYAADHGSLPPAVVRDSSGKPMHSWRVLILPQLGYQDIFDQYNFDVPWDDPQNSQFSFRMPKEFGCPADPNASVRGQTNYMVIVGRGTAFPPTGAVRLTELVDGTTDTLLVVESNGQRVSWVEPRDIDFDTAQLQINGGDIGGNHGKGANVATADAQTHFIPADTPSEFIEAMATRAGREVVPWESIE